MQIGLYALGTELLDEAPPEGDEAAVAKKLLETAAARFEQEYTQSDGSTSATFLQCYAQCTLALAVEALVPAMCDKALKLFNDATTALSSGAGAKAKVTASATVEGGVTPATLVEVLAATAVGHIERARIDYLLTADEKPPSEVKAMVDTALDAAKVRANSPTSCIIRASLYCLRSLTLPARTHVQLCGTTGQA